MKIIYCYVANLSNQHAHNRNTQQSSFYLLLHDLVKLCHLQEVYTPILELKNT